MAYSPQANVSNIDIAKFLKIYSSNGVYNNLSTASEIWKMMLKQKARDPGGRELRYLIRDSYGAAAVQSLPAGDSGDYPVGQRSGLQEAVAQYKDFGMTVNIPRNLLNKTGNDLVQYADPLTEELDAKSIVAARVMSAQALGDGSGAIGRVVSVNYASNELTVVISATTGDAGRSHIGWFEEKDYVKLAAPDATARTATGGAAQFELVSRNDDTDTVVIKAAPGQAAITGVGTVVAGDYIYRIGTTPNDLTAISTNDYNTLSECLVGLESLSAADGRRVNGIVHSGLVSGTRRNASGSAIDSSDFQKVLSLVKRRTGRGRYKYNKALMFDSTFDALVEASETDRRIQTIDDGTRGFKRMGYQHGSDFVEFMPDEFVQKQRIWILPESKEVLEFHGKDFQLVEPNKGQKFHLKTSTSGAGHKREMQAYMEGAAVCVAKHPAAIAVIENFT